MSHDFKYKLPVLPYGVPAEQPEVEVKDGKPKAKSLRELVIERLEQYQKTKARRDYFLDGLIKELRLN